MELQERDFEILKEIAKSPACTRSHLALAFFEHRYEAAKKRIQTLIRHDFVKNNGNIGSGKSILRITAEGLKLLQSIGFSPQNEPNGKVSPRMHKHELMLADCRFALHVALRRAGRMDVEFYEPKKIAFTIECPTHRTRETVWPDGFASVGEIAVNSPRQYLFIEIDRSTETQGRLLHLAGQYRAYRQSGEFAATFGSRYEPKLTTFRVLLIVQSKERLISTAKNFWENGGIETLIWLTVASEFVKNPLGPIWLCPRDFGNSPGTVAFRTLF